MLEPILKAYNLNATTYAIQPFGSGLINNTWKVSANETDYILQKINNAVFKKPHNIANNISVIAAHLKQHHPDYLFVSPTETVIVRNEANRGQMLYKKGLGYFRMFPFVPNSHSKDVVETPEQAYQAAAQFGRFTKLLSGLDMAKIKTTIPHFHDIGLRYKQFLTALKNGNPLRIAESKDLINALSQHVDIVKEYKAIQKNPDFKIRVTHHDTKISNVLFNQNDKGLCVIDLDTVMQGYFISDVGDMMRTYLSPVSEEEQDFNKITVRDDFYKAIVQGYFDEMKDELTATEKNYFFYAGKFLIYMQALRFLTDYLNNDVYYGSKYEGHNFMRAKNQMVLLESLLNKNFPVPFLKKTTIPYIY
jgi:Ser/Thr protein kinase RdoA (MazF antagonist)